MQNLAICIPVRIGSNRLSNKPLIKLGDKTVIEWTISNVLKCKYINVKNVWIFTDSREIIELVNKLGVNTIYTSAECRNALYRLSKYQSKLPNNITHIMNVHGDEPLLDPRNLEQMIKEYLQNPGNYLFCNPLTDYDQSRSSVPKIVFDKNMYLLYCSRADIPCPTKNGPEGRKEHWGIIGIHLIDRQLLREYDLAENPHGWLYQIEDMEELKLLELGAKIKCLQPNYPVEPSLNTSEDLNYYLEKFNKI